MFSFKIPGEGKIVSVLSAFAVQSLPESARPVIRDYVRYVNSALNLARARTNAGIVRGIITVIILV